ncbi:glycosyltransferase family 4 protein [Stratiformator vulcanicus]|uniref:D-inositol-3-phosphate glycosyltransferase n=1 Tax=Stratiformator vulcanicus TaxID=2527980 RepID=A0A517QWL9_9PLAN|nr:glycosyltransferase family 4 protein [Stratiformator vulcanicus]QDT35987.1 D-inositol-3-phosphate glycosyltransferase [Stratiformator vulcanicus]
MKIALCSTVVPFIKGGGRNIVEWLEQTLLTYGHEVDRVYIPEIDRPDLIFQQMMAFRWLDLSAADRIVCFRPQSHLIPHDHKILWFIHHIREFYDLWGGGYSFPVDAHHEAIRHELHRVDTKAISEAKAVFTNSQVVSDRLERFNDVPSEVLYPPVFQPERFRCDDHNDSVAYICRVEHHKRQHLLIDAMRYTTSPVRLHILGASINQGHPEWLKNRIKNAGIQEKVTYDSRWISEKEKADVLANCLAAAYLPLDEDSYGYPSVEASHAEKALLTTTDAGGVTELVEDNYNGIVSESTPEALAEALDRLYYDRQQTVVMGRNAKERLSQLNISWDHVVERLVA